METQTVDVNVGSEVGEVDVKIHLVGELPQASSGSLAEQLVEAAKTPRNPGPKFEEFCLTWNASKTQAEFCETTGMTQSTAYQRYRKYVNEGVALNKLPSGQKRKSGSRLNIAHINELLAKAAAVVETPAIIEEVKTESQS